MKNNWQNFWWIILIIIIGSAVLIWGYNFLQGKNLAKPPVFDLSIYNNLRIPHPDELFREEGIESVEGQGEIEESGGEINNDITKEFVYQYNSVYFSQFFRGKTPIKTRDNVDNFIKEFEGLAEFDVKDLVAKKCFVVRLPLENRGETLDKFKNHELIVTIEPGLKGAPEFDLCFNDQRYLNEIKDFLIDFELVTLLSEEEDSEYIAGIDFGEKFEKYKLELEKLELEYSDVVKVVGGE